ncbi:Hepatic leukemia factor, partial [Stegodyphus mimosarum]
MGLVHQGCLECGRTLNNITRPQLFTKPMIYFNSIIKHEGSTPFPSTSQEAETESRLPATGSSAPTETASLSLEKGETSRKDENYYRRRKNNNLAAKKCREAKKLKYLQLQKTVIDLELENAKLKKEADCLTAELVKTRGLLQKLKGN